MTKLPFKVRSSRIQGMGAFATRRIRNGTRIIEYVGERISPKQADTRYDGNHGPGLRVLIFQVDKRTIIDAGAGGNEARFINHSCEPNCEAVIDSRRIYIEALRTISPGEELTYDYNLTRDDLDDIQTEADYACNCGASTCRGTMLEPLRTRKNRKRKKSRK